MEILLFFAACFLQKSGIGMREAQGILPQAQNLATGFKARKTTYTPEFKHLKLAKSLRHFI